MGNFRNTKQSKLILDIINKSCDHLNASEVYQECLKSIKNISLGTVYRNLNNLVDNNMIRKIIDLNGVEHFDNFKCLHNHFICVNCLKIIDVFDEINVPLKCDFGKIVNYEIFYKGICYKCLEKENDENGTKRK